MTAEQDNRESESEKALRQSTRAYEMGNALLDLLETTIVEFEKQVNEAGRAKVDDLRRLRDHVVRVKELVLRLYELNNKLGDLALRLYEISHTLDNQARSAPDVRSERH